MIRYERFMAALLLAAVLMGTAACESSAPSAGQENGESSLSSSVSAPAPEEANPALRADGTYNALGEGAPFYSDWDPDGNLVFQYKNTLNTLDPDNRLVGTVTLPEEHLPRYGYALSGSGSLVLAVSQWGNRHGTVYFTDDGGVHLANVVLFDRQGELVRKYPESLVRATAAPGPETVYYLPVPQGTEIVGCSVLYDGESLIYWLDGETAVFNCHSRVVLYDFAADTGRVLDDMSELVDKHGKFGVYYGVQQSQCGVLDGSFYYYAFRSDIEGETGGTICRADKNGMEKLFDGRKFRHLFVGSHGLMLAEHTDPANSESADRVSYLAPGTDQLREVFQGNLSISFRESGQYLAFKNSFGREDSVLYAYNCHTGELSSHSLGEIVQVNDLWVRPADSSLRYYYTTFVKGTEAGWVYDAATDTTTQLPDGIVENILSVSPDGSRVLRLHEDGSARLQVGLWEP